MILSKKILAIILAFFVIDNVFGYLLVEVSKRSSFRYSQLYTNPINADVVFIGNSIAVNSFYSPSFNKLTGLKSFNLSFNGLTFPIINILIDDYLQRNTKPKVIYIEISGLSSNQSDILTNFKQYIPDSELIANRIKSIYPGVYYSSLVSKSFPYNSEFFLRTMYYLIKDDQSWINMNSISESRYNMLDAAERHKLVLKDMSRIEILEFSDLVKSLSKKGVKVVPVLAPIIDKYRDKKEIDEYINNFEKNTGTRVVDLSDSDLDIEMFADSIHTNKKGAEIVINKLILISKSFNLI